MTFFAFFLGKIFWFIFKHSSDKILKFWSKMADFIRLWLIKKKKHLPKWVSWARQTGFFFFFFFFSCLKGRLQMMGEKWKLNLTNFRLILLEHITCMQIKHVWMNSLRKNKKNKKVDDFFSSDSHIFFNK